MKQECVFEAALSGLRTFLSERKKGKQNAGSEPSTEPSRRRKKKRGEGEEEVEGG